MHLEPFTDGKWKATPAGGISANGEVVICATRKGKVAEADTFNNGFGHANANRRLVMSAPDLYAACTQLLRAYEEGERNGGSVDWSDLDEAHAMACKALRRAHGR